MRQHSPASAGLPLWNAILSSASAGLPPAAVEELTRCARPLEATSSRVCVAIPCAGLGAWVRQGWLHTLVSATRSASDGRADLSLIPYDGALPEIGVDPSHTLRRFIASPANTAARSAAERAAHGELLGEILLFTGPAGSGKTHLLSAIARDLAEQEPVADRRAHVICLGAEQLSIELATAISSHELQRFRDTHQGCAALVVDDLEALEGREATQSELAAMLGVLRARSATCVLACTQDPEQISGLGAELAEHLQAARRIELALPDWETRVAILLDRARCWGIGLEPSAAALLVREAGPQVERLDELLTHCMTQYSGDAAIDISFVRQVIHPEPSSPRNVPPDVVLATVARHYNVRIRDLRSAGRSLRLNLPRQVAMYLLRRCTRLSYPEIGRRFGRHHTTALYSYQRIADLIEEESRVRVAVRLLEKELDRPDRRG
jgi:chromosomal replication initiator protein